MAGSILDGKPRMFWAPSEGARHRPWTSVVDVCKPLDFAVKVARATQVLHRSKLRYKSVNNSVMFSIVWMNFIFFLFIFNGLKKCLIFRHIMEMGQKQRKNAVT